MDKKKLIALSLLLINTHIFAAELIPPSNKQNNYTRQIKNNKNIKIKNIKTLKQLEESLNKVEKILQQEKIIKEEKKISKAQKEQMERMKRKKELAKMQRDLTLKQRIYNIKQEENILKRTIFEHSPEYINLLINILKQRISLIKNEIKLIKIPKEYPLKVFNVYRIGNTSYGYAPENKLRNIASLLKVGQNLQNQIHLEITELMDDLKFINKKIININPDIFTKELYSLTNVFGNLRITLNKIINLKENLNKEIQPAPELLVMSVYKTPDNNKKSIKIKEGDMITNNIQVKKISNGYAIIGLIGE